MLHTTDSKHDGYSPSLLQILIQVGPSQLTQLEIQRIEISHFRPPICNISGNMENPDRQYHTNLTAPIESKVALIVQ